MPIKPSDSEEEYFKREEMERLRRARQEVARELAGKERDELKRLHWMRCPKCGMELAEIEFRGVQVDACFTCGGTYFDRGEIEKALAHKEPGMLGRMLNSLFERER